MITSSVEVWRLRRDGRWPFGDTQELVRVYRIGRLRIWSSVMDREEIPPWALIQLSTLGYTDWISKFAEQNVTTLPA